MLPKSQNWYRSYENSSETTKFLLNPQNRFWTHEIASEVLKLFLKLWKRFCSQEVAFEDTKLLQMPPNCFSNHKFASEATKFLLSPCNYFRNHETVKKNLSHKICSWSHENNNKNRTFLLKSQNLFRRPRKWKWKQDILLRLLKSLNCFSNH